MRLTSRSRTLRRKARWGIAAAAGILLLILSTLSFTTPQASAETVVQQAALTHQQPVDRLYELEIRPDPQLLQRFPALPPHRSQVWTRGHSFWVEMATSKPPWHWGRDGQGRIWLALNPHLGLRFDPNEIPDPLEEFMALRSADVPAILRDVLQHCELQNALVAPTRRVIQGKGRHGRHPFPVLEATLEIDPVRHELRSLTLRRGDAQGKPLGTITLKLVRRAPHPAERYQLESHLQAPYRIVDRQQPLQRLRLFLQHIARP